LLLPLMLPLVMLLLPICCWCCSCGWAFIVAIDVAFSAVVVAGAALADVAVVADVDPYLNPYIDSEYWNKNNIKTNHSNQKIN